jgi:hypothetical protein
LDSSDKLKELRFLPDNADEAGLIYAEKFRAVFEVHMEPVLDYCRRYYSDLKGMIGTGDLGHDIAAEQAITAIIADKKQFILKELLELTNLYRSREKVPSYYDNHHLIDFYEGSDFDEGPCWREIGRPYGLFLSQYQLTKVEAHMARLGYITPAYKEDSAERLRAFQAKVGETAKGAGIHLATLDVLMDERPILQGENKTMLSHLFFDEDILQETTLRDLLSDDRWFSETVYHRLSFPYARWVPSAGGIGHPSEAQAAYVRTVLHPIAQKTFLDAFSRVFPEISPDKIYVPKITQGFETEAEVETRVTGYRAAAKEAAGDTSAPRENSDLGIQVVRAAADRLAQSALNSIAAEVADDKSPELRKPALAEPLPITYATGAAISGDKSHRPEKVFVAASPLKEPGSGIK